MYNELTKESIIFKQIVSALKFEIPIRLPLVRGAPRSGEGIGYIIMGSEADTYFEVYLRAPVSPPFRRKIPDENAPIMRA